MQSVVQVKMQWTRILLIGLLPPFLFQLWQIYTIFFLPDTFLPPIGWNIMHMIGQALFIICPLLAIGTPYAGAAKRCGCERVPWVNGTVAVLAGFLVSVLLQVLYNIIAYVTHIPLPQFGLTQSAQAIVPFLFFVVILGPICEEFYFRGFLKVVLPNVWVFALVSTLYWACLHADKTDLVPLLCAGGVLAFVRVHTKSIYPCIAIHMLLNASAVLLYFIK